LERFEEERALQAGLLTSTFMEDPHPSPRVRVAFLSDIHANQHALARVLEHAESEGVDQLYCLGDIVGYNAFPNECIAALRKAGVHAVMGNHDWAATVGEPEGFNVFAVAGVEHSRRTLTEDNKRWLIALPQERRAQVEGQTLAMYHGSPRDPLLEYVFPFTDPQNLEEMAKAAGSPRVVALGHTHLPMQVGKRTMFLNPGSVGQPRDSDPRCSYAILDLPSMAVHFHRLDYDVDGAARAVREAGLPDFLWQRLLQGV
jgi:putative phosphoesterase